MKSQLPKLELQHVILMSEMQLHCRLAKTLEELLRKQLSSVEDSFNAHQTADEVRVHSSLARTLENQLRHEIDRAEKCFGDMENFSVDLLSLEKDEELYG